MSGLRKREIESLTRDDVDFDSGLLKVRAKEGFKPKTWKERTMAADHGACAGWQAAYNNCNFLSL